MSAREAGSRGHPIDKITASHWGVEIATVTDGTVTGVTGHPNDPSPSDINHNIAGSLHGAARVVGPCRGSVSRARVLGPCPATCDLRSGPVGCKDGWGLWRAGGTLLFRSAEIRRMATGPSSQALTGGPARAGFTMRKAG